MNWKAFWDTRGKNSDPLAQVARVGGNAAQTEEMIERIVQHILQTLDLKPEDTLLDVCCGNGLLTARLAKHCKKVTGVDFSEVLISEAKKNYPHIEFHCADAKHLETSALSPEKFTRINLYFSFQYFESFEEGRAVVKNLVSMLDRGGRIFLGDIPDRDRFFVYYHSAARIFQLIRQMLANRNDMGKFWSEDELRLICEQLGVKGEKRKQPSNLPYASYRMDWLITG